VEQGDNCWVNRLKDLYKRHRFPPEIIQYAVWLYFRFNLSHRDIEDILAERGIIVSYESIRCWCNKFGPKYTMRLKRTRVWERGMRRFKSTLQAQRFLSVHAAVCNLFNLGRHMVPARHYRNSRQRAFASWKNAVTV
jgi:transposase-like protein